MIYGERIVQARELHQLTQNELADDLNISRAALASHEIGRLDIQEDLLQQLSRRFDLLPGFFKKPVTEHFALGTLQFRGKTAMNAKERDQAYQLARLVYEIYENLERRVEGIPFRLRCVVGDPESASLEMRSQLGLAPDVPISNLLLAFESAGVVVQALPLALRNRDGFSGWASSGAKHRPVISLPTGTPGDRQRMTAAHELGEMLYDHNLTGRHKEDACTRFGAALLLPRAVMQREIRRPVNLISLAMLKRRWGVSIQALAIRAHQLEIISKRQYYTLFRQIGIRGWRKEEPAQVSVPVERPRALRKMAEIVYGNPINIRRFVLDTQVGGTFLRQLLLAHSDSPAANVKREANADVIPFPGHVYIERRPDGKYAVMAGESQRASGLYDTQAKAIAAAKQMYPDVKPDVEQQRNTKAGNPDHWRP